MTFGSDELIAGLKNGTLDPEEAIRKFEMPCLHISDISIDDVFIETLPCGFPSLDKMEFLKKERGELVVIGARPGMGKSSLMMQLALNVANGGGNVLIFSLEMTAKALVRRAMATISERPIKSHDAKMRAAYEELCKKSIFIDDRSPLDMNQIMAATHSLNKEKKIDLVVIDYLQYIKVPSGPNRHSEVSAISKQLKQMSKDLKIPVVVASALNRGCERRGKEKGPNFGDYRPILSDLAESGGIESDADVVLFLSRQEVFDGSRPSEADVGISKNRDGATGWIKFKWSGSITKFFDEGVDPI